MTVLIRPPKSTPSFFAIVYEEIANDLIRSPFQSIRTTASPNLAPKVAAIDLLASIEMTSKTTLALPVGQVFEIKFPKFIPRITIRSESELTVEILTGAHKGFSDTMDYQAVAIRDGLVMLSWQEHIGSTIVHVLDFVSGEAYTAVTPAEGQFMRIRGRIEIHE